MEDLGKLAHAYYSAAWATTGTVVWSDEPRLIGQRFVDKPELNRYAPAARQLGTAAPALQLWRLGARADLVFQKWTLTGTCRPRHDSHITHEAEAGGL